MFSVTDPQNRLVILTQENWDAHIVKRHPDVVPDWISDAIEEPDFIVEDTTVSKKRRKRLCYYKQGILPRYYGDSYMKVVVQLRSSKKPCLVITAYPAERKKPEEQIIWNSKPHSSKQHT